MKLSGGETTRAAITSLASLFGLAPLVGLALLVGSWSVHAQVAGNQAAGDAAKGRQFAQQICTECHNIDKGQRPSPNGLAPNFETIAKTPGLTAIALTAALRTSHRTMPNIIIPDDDLRNVVAYVLTLQ